MDTMQVVRQGADDAAVDSGTPWRLYVVDDDFAFAETDDTDEAPTSTCSSTCRGHARLKR